VAWLPHSPMLAFDILSSYGGGIEILPWSLLASCAAPPSSWATKDDPSYTVFLFNLSLPTHEVFPLTKFCLHLTNNFSPMLERETSTCTFSSHLH
jgi:hypothetical protein